MKFYSDYTKKLYDSVAECEKAENAAKLAAQKKEAEENKKATERKADAAKVEKAMKNVIEARKEYEKELVEFCKKWGAYHKSVKVGNEDKTIESLIDMVNFFV